MNSTSDGIGFSVYLRRDGGDPVRLASGTGVDLSPDGRSAFVSSVDRELTAVPIGSGLPTKIDLEPLRARGAAWLPSARGGLIVEGSQGPNEPSRLWVVDEAGATPRPLSVTGALSGVSGARAWAIAPDGSRVAAKTSFDSITLAPLGRGPTREIRGMPAHLDVSRWSGDGQSLYLAQVDGWPCEIHRLDLSTETIEPWKQVAPPAALGILWCDAILPSADGRSYVYAANRSLASLIVAEGLR